MDIKDVKDINVSLSGLWSAGRLSLQACNVMESKQAAGAVKQGFQEVILVML